MLRMGKLFVQVNNFYLAPSRLEWAILPDGKSEIRKVYKTSNILEDGVHLGNLGKAS